jgi:hypothetical protein
MFETNILAVCLTQSPSICKEVKMYRGEAKLSGCRNVVEGVVDENGPANVQAAPANKELEYCQVRLHEPNVARED